VLYYQAVDLDPALLGIKVPAEPPRPDVTVASSPASATNASTTNEMPSLELSEPALPPGLGEPSAHSPVVSPTPHPPISHPPIPTAPSSPSLVTPPLSGSVTLLSRKKSLPSIRIPGISESSTTSPTTPNRTHGGGLFHTLRSSPSSSKIRPSTAEGLVSTRSGAGDAAPPVPPVPLRYMNGKEAKDKDKDKGGEREKEKEKEKEREEERSSKEFDRKPSLWFKLRSGKPTKDDREREKEKEKDAKGKEKDPGSAPAHTPAAVDKPSATALAAVPSQSDGASSVSGASSLWRRSSARVGHHVRRLSATHSTTALGETDTTGSAATAPLLASSSLPSHPHPHPHSHHHHHHHHHPHHHHHHHHHHQNQHQEPPGQLAAVPATSQNLHPDPTPSSPSSTSSSPVLVSAIPDSPTLPAWRISPSSPPLGTPSGSKPPGSAPPSRRTHGERTSAGDDNDHDHDANHDRDSDSSDDNDRDHLRARVTFFAGRLRRRRPHSVHGSGSGTLRERSTSPHEHEGVPSPQSPAEPAEPGGGSGAHTNGVTAPSSSSASATSSSAAAKGKEHAGFRHAARKFSLNAHLFGIGLGLGGRDKDRAGDHHQHHQDQPQQQHQHLSKKEDGNGKKASKTRPTSSLFGLGGSSAALASAVP
jgi:hypothetical protein